MTIHIHPAEDQDSFTSLAMNLFMQTAAETILAEKEATKQHPA